MMATAKIAMATNKSTIRKPHSRRDAAAKNDFASFQFHNDASIAIMAISMPNMAVAISPTTTPFKITSPLVTACAAASSC